MSSAENNQSPVTPALEIDGLKVKEAVNATLNSVPTTPQKLPVTTSPSVEAPNVVKSSPSKIVKKKGMSVKMY
jgi:hypothetical protein